MFIEMLKVIQMIKKQILSDETLYIDTLDNGLKVYMHPKADFIDYRVALQVGIGGEIIDYKFNEEAFSIPAGTAHFIEHVLFEKNKENLSDLFAKYNADVNASTSRDVTQYYFTTQENFEEVFSLFLNHFSSFDISDTTVKKEREIILREIKMYEDNLFYQLHDDLMKHMFKDEKVWQDVAGTEESVKAISKDIILQTLKHFYQPKNMSLVISGPFKPERVKELIQRSSMSSLVDLGFIPRLSFDTSGSKNHHVYKVNKNQSVNYFALGLKIDLSLFSHLSTNQKRIAIIMYLLYYFDESSKYHELLKTSKLINYTYSTSIQIYNDYAYFLLASESKQPKLLKDRVINLLHDMDKVDPDVFIASKRKRIGNFIGYFDNAHTINRTIADFIKKGIKFDAYIKNVQDISFEDMQLMKETIKKDNIYTMIYANK